MTTNMFATIKDALATPAQTTSSTGNILRLRTGNTYTVRLVPFTKEPAKTFFHYYSHYYLLASDILFQLPIQIYQKEYPL